jgi:hypothetical protein
MRFLDLDLDFFLNKNAYRSHHEHGRLDSEYIPWSRYRVRHFLEGRCGLSLFAPAPGRVFDTHDEVLGFWRSLIDSGRLTVPFDVIHIDAHPDLSAEGWMSLAGDGLHIDTAHGLAALKTKDAHAGNYLTFALAYGWVHSLVWIPLFPDWKDAPAWDADARAILMQSGLEKNESVNALYDLTVPFRVMPRERFKTHESFDYITLSKSPAFTPRESDALVTVVEEYMKQI